MPLLPAPSLGFVLDLTSIKMLGLLTELQPFGRPLDLLYKFFLWRVYPWAGRDGLALSINLIAAGRR